MADVHGYGLVVGGGALRDGARAGDLGVDGGGDVLLKDDGEVAVEARLARKVLCGHLLVCTARTHRQMRVTTVMRAVEVHNKLSMSQRKKSSSCFSSTVILRRTGT